jgi:hypothetical protein
MPVKNQDNSFIFGEADRVFIDEEKKRLDNNQLLSQY